MRRENDGLTGAGVFRNSLGRWAGYGYGGRQSSLVQTPAGPIRLGGIAGATHHYFWNNGGIVPLAAMVLTIPLTKNFAVELLGIPRIRGATYATLHVSLSWRLR